MTERRKQGKKYDLEQEEEMRLWNLKGQHSHVAKYIWRYFYMWIALSPK